MWTSASKSELHRPQSASRTTHAETPTNKRTYAQNTSTIIPTARHADQISTEAVILATTIKMQTLCPVLLTVGISYTDKKSTTHDVRHTTHDTGTEERRQSQTEVLPEP